MKEFKLYIGVSKNNTVEMLHLDLKNDTVPEKFLIQSVNGSGVSFPTRYVKIVPLS
jgi:muskelin